MASSADESREPVETQTVKPEHPKDPKLDEPANPEFEHFEDLARKLLKVSKTELDEKRNGTASN
ncbi:MAG: hypothetical protein QOG33_1507 [Gaiellales bacterium]|jgi:hypothetical protein|nr:hypothetical protein [Gaiellales bacterium]